LAQGIDENQFHNKLYCTTRKDKILIATSSFTIMKQMYNTLSSIVILFHSFFKEICLPQLIQKQKSQQIALLSDLLSIDIFSLKLHESNHLFYQSNNSNYIFKIF
jgi:hypothetical protein